MRRGLDFVKRICYVLRTLALCASLSASAFAADLTGAQHRQGTFCVDAKSAALLGQTVDEDAAQLPEVIPELVRRKLCVFVPMEFAPSVKFEAKVQHIAKTDVWRVDWEGSEWYVAVDAPREPDL